MRYAVQSLIAFLALAAPAVADEAWSTQLGEVFWESDAGDTAVLALHVDTKEDAVGETVRFYIVGLSADVMGGRGAYSGYWTSTSDEPLCDAGLTDSSGKVTHAWGRIDMTSVSDAFPSQWTAQMGHCFADPDSLITGVPITGE